MPDTTLTINHAGGGSETYTINRDKFEGIRNMTRKLGKTLAPADPENITSFVWNSNTFTKQSATSFTSGSGGTLKEFYVFGGVWKYGEEHDPFETQWTANQSTDFPWEVTSWTAGDSGSPEPTPEAFSNFVGGSITDTLVDETDTVSVDHTPPEDLRNLLIDAQNITINRDKGEEIRTLFIDGVEVTIDRTGEVVVEGFLTLFPNAAAAYSLQRLNGHQALINGRRDSDGVEVDVYPDSSANREVSASSPITVTSGSSSATTFGEFLTEATPARNRNGSAKYSTFTPDGVTGFTAITNSIAAGGFDIAGASGADVQVSFDITLNSGTISVKLRPDFETGSDVSNEETITTSGSKSFTLTSTADFKAMLFITASADYVISNFSVNVPHNHDAFVTTWYDQSGNNNDASQSLDDSQPKIAEGGSVIAGGIKFSGTSSSGQFLKKETFEQGDLITPNTIFAVAKYDGGSSQARLFDGSTFTKRHAMLLDGGEFSYFSGGVVRTGLASNTNRRVYSLLFNSPNSFFYLDGSSISSGDDTGSQTFGGINIGVNNNETVHFWDGTISELIIYASDQSANREAIEANINGRYSIY